jgi:hypothetical protein
MSPRLVHHSMVLFALTDQRFGSNALVQAGRAGMDVG